MFDRLRRLLEPVRAPMPTVASKEMSRSPAGPAVLFGAHCWLIRMPLSGLATLDQGTPQIVKICQDCFHLFPKPIQPIIDLTRSLANQQTYLQEQRFGDVEMQAFVKHIMELRQQIEAVKGIADEAIAPYQDLLETLEKTTMAAQSTLERRLDSFKAQEAKEMVSALTGPG